MIAVMTSPRLMPALSAALPGCTSLTSAPRDLRSVQAAREVRRHRLHRHAERPRRTLPLSMSCVMTFRAMFAGIAKPMPMLPPDGDRICELMPTSSPWVLTSAPPELPLVDRRVGLEEVLVAAVAAAAVARPFALTIPIVTVWPMPSGLPTASTTSPTWTLSELPSGSVCRFVAVDLQHREIARRVGADDLGRRTCGRRSARP